MFKFKVILIHCYDFVMSMGTGTRHTYIKIKYKIPQNYQIAYPKQIKYQISMYPRSPPSLPLQ